MGASFSITGNENTNENKSCYIQPRIHSFKGPQNSQEDGNVLLEFSPSSWAENSWNINKNNKIYVVLEFDKNFKEKCPGSRVMVNAQCSPYDPVVDGLPPPQDGLPPPPDGLPPPPEENTDPALDGLPPPPDPALDEQSTAEGGDEGEAAEGGDEGEAAEGGDEGEAAGDGEGEGDEGVTEPFQNLDDNRFIVIIILLLLFLFLCKK